MRSIIVAGAIIASLFGAVAHAEADAGRTWHPCKHEDGSGQARCVWDARHMGNGSGDSLIIRHGGTDDARYRYVTHKRAHRLIGDQL